MYLDEVQGGGPRARWNAMLWIEWQLDGMPPLDVRSRRPRKDANDASKASVQALAVEPGMLARFEANASRLRRSGDCFFFAQ